MKKRIAKFSFIVTLILIGALALAGTALADVPLIIPLHNDTAQVGEDCPDDGGAYWHFVISPNNDKSAFIVFHLNLGDAATYDTSVFIQNGDQWDNVFVPVPTGKTLESLIAANSTAEIIWEEVGPQPDSFQLSHLCLGRQDYEELTVNKTVNTSYVRTHDWSIDKSVATDYGYTHEGYPKIWLYVDGHGNESATWTVNVNYEGYQDSDWYVNGDITVTNTGTLDAVITSIDDVMAGAPLSINCGDTFALPYTLPVGGTLTCTYGQAGYLEGVNEVTVTTERAAYSDSAAITWGDPTTEYYKTVTVKDVSDLFGEVILGAVTAPNGATYTYSKTFAWADYGEYLCGDYTYNNTATIVETGESASATLKVNVQCYIYETAYAKGNSPTCFIPTFDKWGWTNYIPGRGYTYTWNLWAGAGQCDTSKGTLVGTVTVSYNLSGYVSVTYNVGAPYLLKETHAYAGVTKFPKTLVGRRWVYTVAPGAYTITSPLNGPIYVIAHAVVGIPDPTFGP